MSSCCSEWSVCSSICTRILRVSMRLSSLLSILLTSSGLCRPRGHSTLSTPGAPCPSRFIDANSYGLEMRLFDPSYVILCHEASTLRTENCQGLAQISVLQCQTVSRVLEVNKKQCQQSKLSLAAACQLSHVNLFVSLSEQSADPCWNNKNWQLAENCLACLLTS